MEIPRARPPTEAVTPPRRQRGRDHHILTSIPRRLRHPAGEFTNIGFWVRKRTAALCGTRDFREPVS